MKTDNRQTFGLVLVLTAGVFWGSMGLFVRRLSALGFSAIQITAARLSLAGLCFALLLLCRERRGFRIRVRDLPLFLALGLLSILFFTLCYFSAMTRMPLSTAAILLYTSPIWVTLLSALFLHEKLTGRKLLALALAFTGCALVSGLSGGLTLSGLLLGLGSGLGYGLYSIFGALALRRYSPFTVTAWTFLIAGAGAWCVTSPADCLAVLLACETPWRTALLLLLMALVTAVVPFLCYTLGLRRVEAGKAAIFATVEPLVATLFGVLIFHEPLTASSALGMALILSAVVILNRQ